tara:strand:- start:760 stop:1086 length:327 start_codon:yes stop_codon:yes gene_type:complete
MSPQKLGMSQYDILDMIDEGTPIKKEVSQKSKVIKHNIPSNGLIDMDSSQENILSNSSSIKLDDALNQLKNESKNVANLTITTELKSKGNKKKGQSPCVRKVQVKKNE